MWDFITLKKIKKTFFNRFLYRKRPIFQNFLPFSALLFTILLPFTNPQAQTILPPGAEITTSIDAGQYNLRLSGTSIWTGARYINASLANFSLDGAGNTVYVRGFYMLGDFRANNSITLKNINFTRDTNVNTQFLLGFLTGVTSNVNLEGTTFSGFNTNLNRNGGIITVNGLNANAIIDGGTTGVTFYGNRASADTPGVVALEYGSLTFNGKVTFDSNWTGNYGGAVTVFERNNHLVFNGETTFRNNHSVVFGGAMDLWGGNSRVEFNGPTVFDGNYVRYVAGSSTESPPHVTDQDPRGGAINIGYLLGDATITFNGPTSFTNNYVVNTVAGKNSLGGALSAYGNLNTVNYKFNFNDSALFSGNYVYTAGSGTANGGAIYFNANNASLSLTSGTQFLNNYAMTRGGAIYLQSGIITLNAATNDITFRGNRQGIAFDSSLKPIVTSGTPNSIYFGTSGSLNLTAGAGQTIHMYDPISSGSATAVTVTKNGAGSVIFYGDNGLSSAYDSVLNVNTTVDGGFFTLTNGAKYGNTTSTASIFNINSSGTLRGANSAELRAYTLNVSSSGAIGVAGGTFTLNAGTINMNAGSVLTGYGTLASIQAINLLGAVNVNITGTDNLTVSGRLAGASGTLRKTGTGTLTLTNNSSAVNIVNVEQGMLTLAPNGAFNAGAYTTLLGGATTIGANSVLTLTGALTQQTGSTLNVALRTGDAITAASAALGGTLNITGYRATPPVRASDLASQQHRIIHTTTGITGSFSQINSDYTSNTDYLTVNGYINANDYYVGLGLTWFAGINGNGVFTLQNAGDAFEVDMVLPDMAPAADTGWDGRSLTKYGAGNLTLSEANTYTGATVVNGGTLTAGIANAFAQSGNVGIYSGGRLNLNGFNQVARNLTGNGEIILGSGILTAANSTNSIFSGVISGTGTVLKNGTETLTLSGINTYTGGTNITQGRLISASGTALGTGNIANATTLELQIAGNSSLGNLLTGSGTVEKTGAGTLTLTNAASSAGIVYVTAGTLAFGQNGTFNAGTYTTQSGATTTLGSASKLTIGGVFTQNTGSHLNIALGSGTAITANSATITGSTLSVTGLNTATPATASALNAQQMTVIATTTGITGDFSAINFGGGATPADYLLLAGGKSTDNNRYTVGLGLAWLGGAVNSNGIFTLENSTDVFDVDIALGDQAVSNTGWDGKSLTKNGEGNLTLSAANTYTGSTIINSGTLTTGAANTFIDSSSVVINSDALLNMNGHAQTANSLSGSGNIALGNGALTANNSANTLFGGIISGSGSVTKTGAGTLTLSGNNTYTGGTTVSAGRLIATSTSALGTGNIFNTSILELNVIGGSRFNSQTLTNQITGSGTVEKIGTGTLVLTSASSFAGTVDVKSGTLNLAQNGTFNAVNYSTQSGAATSIAAGSELHLTGIYTQHATSALYMDVGSSSALITADAANLDGDLTVSGLGITTPSTATGLTGQQFALIETLNGINGNFSTINFGNATSPADYLLVEGRKSIDSKIYSVGLGLTWLAGASRGNGTFTLTDAADTFDVDVVLGDQAPSSTGWDGRSLTKNGEGNLTLSAVNTYTGSTIINNGTLITGISNAFAQSSNVDVKSGALLNLNGYNQTAQNLSGSGEIALGTGILTADNSLNTLFNGTLSGSGSLVKTGAGSFTLSGINTYTGGTTISAGRVIASNSSALGIGDISNTATLELNIEGTDRLTNRITGSGTVEKTGAGLLIFADNTSSVGMVDVQAGTFALEDNITLNAGSYTTQAGAATTIGADSKLDVATVFIQQTGSELNVGVGADNSSKITADTASIDGALSVTGFTTTSHVTASGLTGNHYKVLETVNGIAGDFNSVNFGAAASHLDYLIVSGQKSADNKDYTLGFTLTWFAGVTDGNGNFTLQSATDTFDMDISLGDQAASTTGWDGKSLTKNSDGNLILSAANTYTGATVINGGTLTAGIADTFINSGGITVNSGATLDLDGYNQTANNLSGGGNIALGSAELTIVNNTDTELSGLISGSGSLIKTGSNTLTLSGGNTYTGGTTISQGRLTTTSGGAMGTGTVTNNAVLELNIAGGGTFTNQITGTGNLEKTGDGSAVLTGVGSSVTAVNVQAGTLELAQNGAFSAGTYTTQTGAATTVGADSTLDISGVFTQQVDSVLNVGIGLAEPIITADNAAIDGSTLFVTGFTSATAASASQLTQNRFTVLQTVNGITGDFSSVSFGGSASPVDYLVTDGQKSTDNKKYNLGFALTWFAGATNGDGSFTLQNTADTFNMDIALGDQAVSATGWDGKSLTKNGAGALILSAANTYTGSTVINGGTLTAGIADTFINSSNIIVNSGATLNLNGFNQTANDLSGNGNIALGSAGLTIINNSNTELGGIISGSGNLIKTGGSTLTLSGENTYTGGITISQGDIVTSNEFALGTGIVSVANGAAIGMASQTPATAASPSKLTTGAVTNAGIISLANSAVGNILTIRGGLTSNNGTIIMNTVFGDDYSVTDKLVLDGGSTGGITNLVIHNQGGRGAKTQFGILVVEATGGATTGIDAFVLSGNSSGYRTTSDTVTVGAYDYSLTRGSLISAESWYLTSKGGVARPEAGAYLSIQESSENMFRQTMQSRLMGYQSYIDPFTGKKVFGTVWAVADAGWGRSYADNNNLETTANTTSMRTGADLIGSSSAKTGMIRLGAMLGIGNVNNKTIDVNDSGKTAGSNITGYSVGLYGTWFQEKDRRNGVYIDSWVQYAWFDNNIRSAGLPEESYDSDVWAISLEIGHSFNFFKNIIESWSFDPAAQIIYSSYSGSHTDSGGTEIKPREDYNTTTRIGGRFHGRINTAAKNVYFEPFIEGNWWHSDGKNEIYMNDDIVSSNTPKDIGEIKTGFSGNLLKGLSTNVGLSMQFGSDNYRKISGEIGTKYEW